MACLVGPQWERISLILLGLDISGQAGTNEGSPSLRRKGGGNGGCGEGSVRVGLEGEEGEGCDHDVK